MGMVAKAETADWFFQFKASLICASLSEILTYGTHIFQSDHWPGVLRSVSKREVVIPEHEE